MDLLPLGTDPCSHSPMLRHPRAAVRMRTDLNRSGCPRDKIRAITGNEFLTLTGSTPILRESIERLAKRGPPI